MSNTITNCPADTNSAYGEGVYGTCEQSFEKETINRDTTLLSGMSGDAALVIIAVMFAVLVAVMLIKKLKSH